MPFGQTSPTAGRRGMLSDKHRMSTHRRLLSVIGRERGSQALSNKIGRMLFNDRRTFSRQYCLSF